jgi:hypothetical protein
MPASALTFAMAEWHYDANDERCLHDSRMKSFVFFESVDAKDRRCVDAKLVLLGAYEDREILLEYDRILGLRLDGGHSDKKEDSAGILGDLIIDEVRMTDAGLVLHDILFRSGARWQLECENLTHSETLLERGPVKLNS